MTRPTIVVLASVNPDRFGWIDALLNARGIEGNLVKPAFGLEIDLAQALSEARGVPADFSPVEPEYTGVEDFEEYVADSLAGMKKDEDILDELEAARNAVFGRYRFGFNRSDVVATVCDHGWMCHGRELFPGATHLVYVATDSGFSLKDLTV